MALPDPQLDDRRFQDIVNEAKSLIPRYTPEWTDHNVSDPGVTLIELFAWMTDMILYRLNRVPEKNYLRFMDLLGIQLKDPVPARTLLRFRLSVTQLSPLTIPRGTEVATQRTGEIEPVQYSTDEDLTISPPDLRYCIFSPDDVTFTDYTDRLIGAGEFFDAFQDPPIPGNALHFGFANDISGHTLSLRITCAVEGVGVNPNDPPLAWEAWHGEVDGWVPLEVESDRTGGLNQSGEVILHVPLGLPERVISRRTAYWIRLRVTQPRPRQPMYSATPRFSVVEPSALGGTTWGTHSRLIRSEIVGRVTDTPGERFFLQNVPVLPRRPDEYLQVEAPDGTWTNWQEVTSFKDSQPDDLHYRIDSISGEIIFGPRIRDAAGIERAYGMLPVRGSALRMTQYRTGGGIGGNVGADSLTVLKSSIPYVASVTNPYPGIGGLDAESIESAKERTPRVLQSRDRAVTAADYEFLACEASRAVARARALAVRGDGRSSSSPIGTVELLIVPALSENQERTVDVLRPSAELLDVVRSYLDERRLLGTQLVVDAPSYVGVSTEATVVASRGVELEIVRHAVQDRLTEYLDPLHGGPDGRGWEFGRAVHLSDLHSVIQNVPGVEYCQDLTLYQVDLTTGQARAAGQAITLGEDVLPLTVRHTVTATRRRTTV